MQLKETRDTGLLSRLHHACFSAGWSAEAFGGLFRNPGMMALIAEQDRKAIGMLLLRQAADEAEIITLGVLPSHRRKGVARMLLHEGIALLRQHHIKRLFLEVNTTNDAALGLYRKAGFEKTGRRRGYYAPPDGDHTDALIMEYLIS